MSNNQLLNPRSSFSATLSITSDWHIGSGTGRTGDVDRLVQRDGEGLPYIPAKTLTGIWRDACEVVAWGLDNGQHGSWCQWVDYLFGEQPTLAEAAIETPPRAAALSVRSAHLPSKLKQALKAKPNLKNALTFIKPGISIDAESGCAKEDFLRFEEMVRGGAVLAAECKLILSGNLEQKLAAYALLIAGSQFIERLGGKRRRGAGKCKLLVETNIHPWIDWLETHPQAPPVPDLNVETQSVVIGREEQEENPNDNGWLSVKLRVTTRSPVIIGKRTIGNVVETLDYIPGTHLLRLVKRKLSNLGIDIDRAIAQGKIVVTNATVEIDQQRSKPVPLCLFGEKSTGGLAKGGKVYNRFAELEPEGQLKGERAGYLIPTHNSHLPQYKTVNLGIETHNTIEDEYQRPTSDIGGVYSYEAIQPDTVLVAEIRLCSPLAAALNQKQSNWWNLLNGSDRLGQSKKDHYGAVQLKVIGHPAKLSASPVSNNSELAVWLLSNVLLRDERLRPTASIECFAQELGKCLGVKLTLKDNRDDKLSVMARQHRVDSWQVRWGLPRPSLVGLGAGSCMVFVVGGNLDPVKLTQIEAKGIGDRTAEGYGQICFNHPLLTAETSHLQPATEPPSNSQPPTAPLINGGDPIFDYARIIEREAWREAIRKAVLSLAATAQSRANLLGIRINGEGDEKESQPPMSQLGALRSVLARLQTVTDRPSAIAWLNNLEATPNRKDKWRADSLAKIRTLIENHNQIWQILQKINSTDITLTTTGQQDLQTELWAEAVRTLVDACIRAHKRDLE